MQGGSSINQRLLTVEPLFRTLLEEPVFQSGVIRAALNQAK
jgi:hypothetical protein